MVKRRLIILLLKAVTAFCLATNRPVRSTTTKLEQARSSAVALPRNATATAPPVLSTALSPQESSSRAMFSNRDEPSALSKLTRRIQVFLLAGQVFLSYKKVQFKEKRIRRRLGLSDNTDEDDDHPEILKLWDEVHQLNANRILKAIENLSGFWIKVGQYLSSRADVMPPQYLHTLASLQDGVPAKPFSDIEMTLSEQLTPEALDLIAHIDPDPLSTASIAQVHRATLQDGQEVVIKAQHRGVASLMLQDMQNLRTILRLLAITDPDMDYNPVVDEYTKEVGKELDFRTEAKNMKQIKNLLEKRQIRAVVPSVNPELVTEKVLVMEFCRGFPIRDIQKLDEYTVDRRLLLDRVCSSWAAQMHIGIDEDGSVAFNADPHSGNILVSTDQKDGDPSVPILLDFGLTKKLTPEMKVAFSRLVHASYETDIDGLLESFDEMGLKLNRYDPFQDMQVMQSGFADPAPQSEAAEAKKQKAKEWKERQEAMRKEQGLEKGQKLRNPVDAWPSELIFFTRVSAMLRGLCSRLEVRYPYLATMAEAAGETLRESVPEHERAVGTVYETPDEISTNLQCRLRDLASDLIEADHALGMQVCVIHQGDTIANIAAGILGAGNARPVTPASLFNVFSVSKAVLAAGTLRMLEDKGISVDDPIAKYWPKFGEGDPAKKQITIRHALSHQAGLANEFPPNASIETLTDWEYMKNFIASADAVPSHAPGEETHYHYLSFAWILGGLIEAVTGEPYERYLDEVLIEPVGLEAELHMGGLPDEIAREQLAVLTARTLRDSVDAATPERASAKSDNDTPRSSETRSRLAKFQGREQMMNPSVFNMRKVRAAKIPSANGHASAHALAKLMHALTAKDSPILSSTTLAQAGTPNKSMSRRGSSAMLDNSQASFGLGFQIHELERKKDGSLVRSIGHSGFGGSIVIAIPEMELSVAFTTNQLKMKSVARERVLSAV